jgi:hypothetical protein
MTSGRPQGHDLAPPASVVLDPVDAQDLARLLSVIEDWLMHAQDATLADLAAFLDGDADHVAWITNAAGDAAVMLLRQLRPHT